MKKKFCISYDKFIHHQNSLEKLLSFVLLESDDVEVLIDKNCIITVYNDLMESSDSIFSTNNSYDFENEPHNLDIFVEFCQ